MLYILLRKFLAKKNIIFGKRIKNCFDNHDQWAYLQLAIQFKTQSQVTVLTSDHTHNWPYNTSIVRAGAQQNKQKWPECPAKTQISLGIHPVWSVFTVRFMGS